MVRTVTDIVNDAIDNKAYMPLLRGDKRYQLPVNPFVPILFADWTQIMPVIYQRAQTDAKIKYDFVQNLWLLANGIPEDTTIALNAILAYKVPLFCNCWRNFLYLRRFCKTFLPDVNKALSCSS